MINQCSPMRMFSLTGVEMFIETGAIETRQSMLVFWEMRRHPIQNYADSPLVKHIYERHKIIRRTVTGSRCKIPCHLISPRAIVWMFHHRHKLYMRIPHFIAVITKHRRQFTVVIKQLAVFCVRLTERTKRNLINQHRLFFYFPTFARLHPFLILPRVLFDIPYHTRCRRTLFRIVRIRVCFQNTASVRSPYLILIKVPLRHARNKQFKNTSVFHISHRVAAGIPFVKIPNNADRFSLGSPHGKISTRNAVYRHRMGAEFFIYCFMHSIGKLGDIHRIYR